MPKKILDHHCLPTGEALSDDRFIRSIIKRKVQHLIGSSGFDHQDRNDLEQELFVRVIKSLELFDPEVGHLYPFVCTIVHRQLSNLVRNRSVPSRGPTRIASLNVNVETADEGTTELIQTIGDRELDHRIGRERRLSDEDLTSLRSDMEQVISKLPEKWRILLERRKTQTMPEIAMDMGVPRTTLLHWMQLIRRRFEEANLDKYLEA